MSLFWHTFQWTIGRNLEENYLLSEQRSLTAKTSESQTPEKNWGENLLSSQSWEKFLFGNHKEIFPTKPQFLKS